MSRRLVTGPDCDTADMKERNVDRCGRVMTLKSVSSNEAVKMLFSKVQVSQKLTPALAEYVLW